MRIVSLSLALALFGCATDDQPGQTEPVAPAMESTPYPEDPDMAKADDPTANDAVDEATPADAETVGELTDDPFNKTAPTPPVEDSASESMPEDGLPIPDEGEPYDGAFDNAQPTYEKTPGGEPGSGNLAPATPSDLGGTAVSNSGSGKTTVYVNAILVNVRSSPSFKSPIVRRLLGGAKIHVETKGGWAKIKNGQWLRTKLLSESPTRKVSRAEADKAWRQSKYKDHWKPSKAKAKKKKKKR